jgi:GT2 family glycosyltransferase
MSNRMAEISIVIGTFNRLDSLKRALASISKQTTRSFCIQVTDAGSTDGTLDYLQSAKCDRVVVHLVGKRIGQAKAYNDVFRSLTSPYVCWLSDDNEVVNGGLDEAARILDARPDFGMVGLKVKDMQGPFVHAPYIGGVSPIGVLNVNQGMLRTPLLQSLGGFSEEFRDYGIDPDLTTRVLFAGYSVVYTKRIALLHYRDWGPARDSPEFREKMVRQEQYLELYRKKYGHLANGALGWSLKRQLGRAFRHALPKGALSSTREFLGGCPRDWNNALSARYISTLDPIRSRNQPYHLVQKPNKAHFARRREQLPQSTG